MTATLTGHQVDHPPGTTLAAPTLARLVPVAVGPKKSARRMRLPEVVPQGTCPEVKRVGVAYAAGRRFDGWTVDEGAGAILHVIPNDRHQIKVVPTPSLDWWEAPSTLAALKAEIREAGVGAYFLFAVVVANLIQHGPSHLLLDDLIQSVGWTVRSAAERRRMRRQMWRWLNLFHSTVVVGQRGGLWPDPTTGERRPLRTTGPLIVITAIDEVDQPSLDGSEPPVGVDIAGGWLIERYRGNRAVLQQFGDLRRLAAIPDGQPRGKWARAIGLSLNQLWREAAARTRPPRATAAGQIAVEPPRSFTRRRIFDQFRPDPDPFEILEGRHPGRAVTYWDEACRLLEAEHVIGWYREPQPPTPRRGWTDAWLDAPLDIRPDQQGQRRQAEIAAARRPRQRATGAAR